MSVPDTKVIVNPAAGGGSVRWQWPRIHRQLQKTGLSFDYDFTLYSGHATVLARLATEAGYRCLVVVGGDGTVNEVANGILETTSLDKPTLGIVRAGSACSFARSLNLVQNYGGACSLLIGKGRAVIDVGVVECLSQGKRVQRYFVNTSDVGLGSSIVDMWQLLPNHLGRRFNTLLRTAQGLRCMSKHRNKMIRLIEGEKAQTIFSCDTIIANGQYFANGMRIAPHARLNDGLLDVVSAQDLSRSELLKMWPTLYGGGHIRNPKIKVWKTNYITIESEEELLVEADGILIGVTPASFRVMPSALTIVV
jgi:YegS/Rv2252/BmrU family lipid kinase